MTACASTLLAPAVTYFEGAAGTEWGRWQLESLQRRKSTRPDWWLMPSLCPENNSDLGLGAASRPPCLQRRYSRCLAAQSRLPRFCNELCYTLSVVAALDAFIQSGHKRALLLEDDICATPALFTASTRKALYWMRMNTGEWDAVKLADCYRWLHVVPKDHRPSEVERLTTGTCASPPDANTNAQGARPRNAILSAVPRGQCSHALAITRRMAIHMVEQAFPVSDVFDNLLFAHFARQASNLGMHMRAFNLSLFAQVAKVQSPSAVERAFRSQNHGAATRLAAKTAVKG